MSSLSVPAPIPKLILREFWEFHLQKDKKMTPFAADPIKFDRSKAFTNM
jgi:hypothetical protein